MIENEPHSGRPAIKITDEHITRIRDLVLSHRQSDRRRLEL